MKIRHKIAAAFAGVALVFGGGMVAAPAASAAGGATVCAWQSAGIQTHNTSGVITIVPGWSCRGGISRISPPWGHCYTVSGATSTRFCGGTQLVLLSGRTYYARR